MGIVRTLLDRAPEEFVEKRVVDLDGRIHLRVRGVEGSRDFETDFAEFLAEAEEIIAEIDRLTFDLRLAVLNAPGNWGFMTMDDPFALGRTITTSGQTAHLRFGLFGRIAVVIHFSDGREPEVRLTDVVVKKLTERSSKYPGFRIDIDAVTPARRRTPRP